jgi:hypothetical protein
MSDLSLPELKMEAEACDQWIMINVQDRDNFKSLQLNADLWGDEFIKSVIQGSFKFAQRSVPSIEAMELQSSYDLWELPAIIIIDPNTGQKMHEWTGMPDKESFMEPLIPFMDTSPSSPAAAALVNSAVKRTSFQNAGPLPVGSKGIAGVSHEDEALHDAIAASLLHHQGEVPRPDEASRAATDLSVCGNGVAGTSSVQALPQDLPHKVASPVASADACIDVSAGDGEFASQGGVGITVDGKTAQERAQARLHARSGLSEAKCRVALQLPNQRVIHTFAPDDTVQSVYDLAVVSLPENDAAKPFRLIVAGKDALSDMSSTVESAALHAAMLRLNWE